MRALPRPTGWFAPRGLPGSSAVALGFALGVGACSTQPAESRGYVDPGHTGGSPNVNQVTLRFEGEPFHLGPRTDARITVRVQPAAAYTVRFSLLDGGDGSATSGATLNRDEVVSGPDGRASVVLTTPNSPTHFELRAQVGSAFATTPISVEAGALTNLDVVPKYSGSRSIAEWTASVYPNTSCSSFQAPPGDGPYLVRAASNISLLLADVPAAGPLAVVVRGGALAQGCTTLEAPTPNGRTTVNVSVSNTPVDLGSTVLDLVFGVPGEDEAFKADLQAGATLVQASLKGAADNDVSAVLDDMAALLTPAERRAFESARSDASWDTTLPAALGRYSATRLEDTLTRWLHDGQPALLSTQAFQARLAADASTSELLNVAPQRMGGVLAEAIPLSATGMTWSVDPEDTLAFSASLSWTASSLVCALCSAPAVAESAEIDLSSALSSAFDCEALGAHLANGTADSAMSWAASCDASCEAAFCRQAIAGMVQRACAASGNTASTLSILATGKAEVAEQAQARSFSGSWVGRLTRGKLQASTGGALRGSTPRGF